VQVLKKLENIKAKGVQLKLEREAAAGGASAVGKEGRLMGVLLACIISRVGQNHIYTVYIRYFWLGNHQIYSVYIRIYTVLADPTDRSPCCHIQMQAAYGVSNGGKASNSAVALAVRSLTYVEEEDCLNSAHFKRACSSPSPPKDESGTSAVVHCLSTLK
jgi:hypothetical protein